MTLFKKVVAHLPKWLLAWVCYEIARYLSSEAVNDWKSAILICRCGMKKIPGNLILPMLMSNLYAESGRYHDAMLTEDTYFHQYAEIDLAKLESILFGFYARIFHKNIGYIERITTLLTM